ncbi:hypothetical protein V3C99_007447 [Haemonchus contortus]
MFPAAMSKPCIEMNYSAYWIVLAVCSIFLPRLTHAELSLIDYRIVSRVNRNCFFSPIGCVFLHGGRDTRAHRHKAKSNVRHE